MEDSKQRKEKVFTMLNVIPSDNHPSMTTMTDPEFGVPLSLPTSISTTSLQTMYQNCNRTQNDEEFLYIRFQMISLLLGIIAVLHVRKQKLQHTTLFDQRLIPNQNRRANNNNNQNQNNPNQQQPPNKARRQANTNISNTGFEMTTMNNNTKNERNGNDDDELIPFIDDTNNNDDNV